MKRKPLHFLLNSIGLNPKEGRSGYFPCKCPLYESRHDTSEESSGKSFCVKVNDSGPSIFKCFVCGFSGTLVRLVDFAVEKGLLDWSESKVDLFLKNEGETPAALARIASENLEEEYTRRSNVKPYIQPRMDEMFVFDESYFSSFSNEYHEYAASRGISVSAWEALDLRFSARDNRIVQAIRRVDGKLVGAVGRSVDPNCKLRHFPIISGPKMWVYREDKVRSSAVLVEGPFQAARLYSKGVENVIALQGCNFSKYQLEFLSSLDRITLALDGDPAGQASTDKLLWSLYDTCEVSIVQLLHGESLDDLEESEINRSLSKAMRARTKKYSALKKFQKDKEMKMQGRQVSWDNPTSGGIRFGAGGASSGAYRFWLRPGSSATVTLTGVVDPPISFYEHTYYTANSKFPHSVVSPKSSDETAYDPLVDAGMWPQEKIGWTCIVHEEKTSKGEVRKLVKKALVFPVKELVRFADLKQIHGSLFGTTFLVRRSSDKKSSKIGDAWTFIKKMTKKEMESEGFDLEPLATEEIFTFVDEEQIENIANQALKFDKTPVRPRESKQHKFSKQANFADESDDLDEDDGVHIPF